MKRFVYPLIGALVIVLDQITKHAVRSSMQPGESISVLGEWLRIYYVQNTGTAFSMFEGDFFVTIILTSMLIIGCVIYAIKEMKAGRQAEPLILTCISAGGISNLADRLTLGYVTDMISCGSFAVFNVADMFITCGCVLLMLRLLIAIKKGEDI